MPPPPNNGPQQLPSKPLALPPGRRVPVNPADENTGRPRPTQPQRDRDGGTGTNANNNATQFLPPPPPPLNRQVQSQSDVRFPNFAGGITGNAGRVNDNNINVNLNLNGFGGMHHPPGLERRMSVDNYVVVGGTNAGMNDHRNGAGSAPPRSSRLSTGSESVSGFGRVSGALNSRHEGRPASAAQVRRTNSDSASSLSSRSSFHEDRNRNNNSNTSSNIRPPSISRAQTTPLFLADEPERAEPVRRQESQSYDNMDAETLWRHNHRHLLRYLPSAQVKAISRGEIPMPDLSDLAAANRAQFVHFPATGFRTPIPNIQPPAQPIDQSRSFGSNPSSSSPNPNYNQHSFHPSDLFHADFNLILSETEKMHDVVTDFYAKKKIWLAEQMVKEEGNARKLREEMNVWSWRLSHAKAAFGYLHQRKVCRDALMAKPVQMHSSVSTLLAQMEQQQQFDKANPGVVSADTNKSNGESNSNSNATDNAIGTTIASSSTTSKATSASASQRQAVAPSAAHLVQN